MRAKDDKQILEAYERLKERYPDSLWEVVEKVIKPLKEEEVEDEFLKELEKEAGVSGASNFPDFKKIRLLKDIRSRVCGEIIQPKLVGEFILEEKDLNDCSYETLGRTLYAIPIKRIPFVEFTGETLFGRIYPSEKEIEENNPFAFWEKTTRKVLEKLQDEEELTIRKKSLLYLLVKKENGEFLPSFIELTPSDGYEYYSFEKKLKGVVLKSLFQKGVYALLTSKMIEREGKNYLSLSFDLSDEQLDKGLYAPCLVLALLAKNAVLKRNSYELEEVEEEGTKDGAKEEKISSEVETAVPEDLEADLENFDF